MERLELDKIMSPKNDTISQWGNAEAMVLELAEKVQASAFRPTLIGAIPRGGWIVAALLAQALNIRRTVSVDIDKSDDGISIFPTDFRRLNHERVLLVEDSMVSGKTIFKVARTLSVNSDVIVKTAALVIKTDCPIPPDYYLDSLDELPDFPWER